MTPGAPDERAASGASDRLVIPMDRRTPARALVIAVIGMIGCGLGLAAMRGGPSRLESALHSLLIMGLVFCALTALAAARRLLDRTPGLVLDPEGIVDHSSAIGAGRVRWDEITEIRVTRSAGQSYLTVVVRDPSRFIERGGWVHRRLNEANYRKAGSPVNVTARTLRIPFDQLVARTSEFYRRYGVR